MIAVVDPTTVPVVELRERARRLLDDPSLAPTEPPADGSFRCWLCFREFEKARSDDEALGEMRERFGRVPEDQREMLCDDCYGVVASSGTCASWG